MKPSSSIEVADRTITRVGLGTNRLTNSPGNRRFLEEALAAGLQFLDTAYLYTDGASEATIGAVLDRKPEDVVVATKGGYHPGGGTTGLRAELEESLARLGFETIDLYYLHRDHPEVDIETKMKVLAEYVDEGRIGHVGLSEVGIDQIERARSVMPVAAVQNEFSLAERMHEEVLRHCEAEGIAFVPFFPLRGAESAAVREVADRNAMTPNQAAIAWLLQRSTAMVPIPGTLSIDHFRENLAALEMELPPEDVAILDVVI